MVCRGGIIAGGQVDAVTDGAPKDAAVQSIAIDSALRCCRVRAHYSQDEQAAKPRDSLHSDSFTRSAAPARDRAWRRVPRDKARKPYSPQTQIRLRLRPATTAPPRSVPEEAIVA